MQKCPGQAGSNKRFQTNNIQYRQVIHPDLSQPLVNQYCVIKLGMKLQKIKWNTVLKCTKTKLKMYQIGLNRSVFVLICT